MQLTFISLTFIAERDRAFRHVSNARGANNNTDGGDRRGWAFAFSFSARPFSLIFFSCCRRCLHRNHSHEVLLVILVLLFFLARALHSLCVTGGWKETPFDKLPIFSANKRGKADSRPSSSPARISAKNQLTFSRPLFTLHTRDEYMSSSIASVNCLVMFRPQTQKSKMSRRKFHYGSRFKTHTRS